MPRSTHAYPNAATLARRYEAAVLSARFLHEFDPQGLVRALAALREVRDALAEERGAPTQQDMLDFVTRWTKLNHRSDCQAAILDLRWGWIDGI
jgi:hypothetical protein